MYIPEVQDIQKKKQIYGIENSEYKNSELKKNSLIEMFFFV
jgi:hypothetical protein